VRLQEVAEANAAFPERPVEQGKAWREMIHRYLASTLGLLILALAALACAGAPARSRRTRSGCRWCWWRW
jgi:heme A synthase